jgi:hypothetical protein
MHCTACCALGVQQTRAVGLCCKTRSAQQCSAVVSYTSALHLDAADLQYYGWHGPVLWHLCRHCPAAWSRSWCMLVRKWHRQALCWWCSTCALCSTGQWQPKPCVHAGLGSPDERSGCTRAPQPLLSGFACDMAAAAAVAPYSHRRLLVDSATCGMAWMGMPGDVTCVLVCNRRVERTQRTARP